MEQDDYEEGEIPDSEEEDYVKEEEKKKSEKEPEPDPIDTYNVISRPCTTSNSHSSYRQKNVLNDKSDDDGDDSSATSDEDTDLWKLKKTKYFSNKTDHKNVQISDVIKSPVRTNKNGSTENVTSSACSTINFDKSEKRKKKNDIWGSVLTEQSLSQTMGSIGVERKAHVVNSYRDVEAYDYLKAFDDDRPFGEGISEKPESLDPFQKVIDSDNEEDMEKRGHKRHKRQQNKSHDRNRKRQKRYQTCNPEDSEEVIVKTIVENLHEEKPQLIERILGIIGKKKAVELMYATEDIEEEGGMKTNDGRRRRTPGGVYIQLIKQDKDITKEMLDEMFAEEQKKYRKELHKKSKQRRRERKKLINMLPQSRYANNINKHPNEKTTIKDTEEGDMETTEAIIDNKADISVKSSDDSFLDREEDQLDIILGEEID